MTKNIKACVIDGFAGMTKI